MVEFKQIRFYCLFTNSFNAQTSPKHVCAEPSSCHSIACITSPKCSLICISSYHQCLFPGSSPCLSWPLTAIYPSPVVALKMQVKDKHHALIDSQTTFPIFCILFSDCSFTLPPLLHACAFYIPQNTDRVSLHVRVMHFTRRLQPWLCQGFYCSVLQIINNFINTAKFVPLQVLHR